MLELVITKEKGKEVGSEEKETGSEETFHLRLLLQRFLLHLQEEEDFHEDLAGGIAEDHQEADRWRDWKGREMMTGFTFNCSFRTLCCFTTCIFQNQITPLVGPTKAQKKNAFEVTTRITSL